MRHFMLDLETLGVGNIPVITTAALVKFDITNPHEEHLNGEEWGVDARSCIKAGGKVDGSTVEWWLKQDEEAFKENVISSLLTCSGYFSVSEMIEGLREYIKACTQGEDFRVWSNGATADIKWVESYCAALGVEAPWKLWQVNDVRTITDLDWQILKVDHKKNTTFAGKKHNALDDAKHQAKYVSAIYCHFKSLAEYRKDQASTIKEREV